MTRDGLKCILKIFDFFLNVIFCYFNMFHLLRIKQCPKFEIWHLLMDVSELNHVNHDSQENKNCVSIHKLENINHKLSTEMSINLIFWIKTD